MYEAFIEKISLRTGEKREGRKIFECIANVVYRQHVHREMPPFSEQLIVDNYADLKHKIHERLDELNCKATLWAIAKPLTENTDCAFQDLECVIEGESESPLGCATHQEATADTAEPTPAEI